MSGEPGRRGSSEEPDARAIRREALIFFLLLLGVGVAFVALRVMKDGPEVLNPLPRGRPDR